MTWKLSIKWINPAEFTPNTIETDQQTDIIVSPKVVIEKKYFDVLLRWRILLVRRYSYNDDGLIWTEVFEKQQKI